jgi:hypothetical protein
MSLATYTDLLASVASWANKTDMTAVIPDFVTIAEGRIARDLRIRKQITTTTLTASTSTRNVALPTDWLEFENVSVDGDPETPLQYVTIEHLDARYPEGGTASKPFVYTIEGDNLLLGPAPDSAYTINCIYYARFPALVTYSTNWLFTNHPSIYLYACLREAYLFMMNDDRAAHYDALYTRNVKDLQTIDDRATHSGSALRVKAI